MSIAIIGTGGIGSAIARQLGSGNELLHLASADARSAQTLAGDIGPNALVAADNRGALEGADAVVLALRFGTLKGVIDEIADLLIHKLVVVPSNPVGLDAHGAVCRLLPADQSSGEVVAGWLPAGTRLAMAFGTLTAEVLLRSARRAPEPAVLFYVTDDPGAVAGVESLIETAGFEPARVGGSNSPADLKWAATSMTWSSARHRPEG